MVTAWASTLSQTACINQTTGLVGPCVASSVYNNCPAAPSGCCSNGIVTAGGADGYPTLTLDLGTPLLVQSVRVYTINPGGDPYVAYAVLVGNVPPPGARGHAVPGLSFVTLEL